MIRSHSSLREALGRTRVRKVPYFGSCNRSARRASLKLTTSAAASPRFHKSHMRLHTQLETSVYTERICQISTTQGCKLTLSLVCRHQPEPRDSTSLPIPFRPVCCLIKPSKAVLVHCSKDNPLHVLLLAQPAHCDLAAKPVTRDGSVFTHYRTLVEDTCCHYLSSGATLSAS